jgi:hypothetical protein
MRSKWNWEGNMVKGEIQLLSKNVLTAPPFSTFILELKLEDNQATVGRLAQLSPGMQRAFHGVILLYAGHRMVTVEEECGDGVPIGRLCVAPTIHGV